MDKLVCFKCGSLVEGGVNKLKSHFHFIHGFALSETQTRGGFVCAQNGCKRTFGLVRILCRHIQDCHSDENITGGNFREVVHDEGEVGHNSNDGEQDLMEVDQNEPALGDQPGPMLPDLRGSVLKMLCDLRSNNSVTTSVIGKVTSVSQSIFDEITCFLSEKTKEYLSSKNLLDDIGAQSLLNEFKISNPFSGLQSLDDQIKALKAEFSYIEPVEIMLGTRAENAFSGKTGKWIIKSVHETLQYVPVIDVLTLVLNNREARDVIHADILSYDPQIITSYADGELFRSHPFFSKFKDALQLNLYYDELEIANPLGSKAGIHKLGVIYFSVHNLPGHVNARLASIHVLAVFTDLDRVKYGFKRILEPFLTDLRKLESAEGVTIRVGGQPYVLRASIALFVGDSLAMNLIYGLLGPSANLFCRACLIDRKKLHEGNFGPSQPRTREIHSEHVAMVMRNPFDRSVNTKTGVLEDSALHGSKYFHITTNLAFDIMHDVLEGVGPYELKLVVHNFVIVRNLFSIEYLNSRISFFKYGSLESKNKPQAFNRNSLRNVADHSLKQSAAQMWLLLRAFPFLIHGKVQEDDKHLLLINLLLRIMQIIFAPRVRRDQMPLLRCLINDHHELFLELFPGHNLINKHHHMTHYPESILAMGPLPLSWCMRFEGKHQPFKRLAQVVCNFKNPPKTLIRVAQATQSAEWGKGEFKINAFECDKGQVVPVGDTASAALLVTELGCTDFDEVFRAESIKVNGCDYKVNFYVCVKSACRTENSLPLFGRIEEIICIGSDTFLFLSLCETLCLDPTLNSYKILQNVGEKLVGISSLAAHKALPVWTLPTGQESYINLRYTVL